MENIENIIEKFAKLKDDNELNYWTLAEKKRLLDIYHIISEKEAYIFDLIYRHHGCDSWEDIFRDYDPMYLKDKVVGVKLAIDEITSIIQNEK